MQLEPKNSSKQGAVSELPDEVRSFVQVLPELLIDPSAGSPGRAENPYDVSLSLKLAFVLSLLAVFGEALGLYAVKVAIDEEIQANLEAQQAKREQDSKFNDLQDQITALQEQLKKFSQNGQGNSMTSRRHHTGPSAQSGYSYSGK
ncbi:hypothetical protein [Alteribacter natronophilus]|uniref:hypothetical protein n=1 Tax=Alteribacter natronophilus TaxID=2583810 RepID=UPI00110DB8DB|nr:hypothetical protein [Alteribacter natronophilus]TMW72762.1 hypothetical protein FGB90_00160 [Alteribacter natronophilus]